MEPIPSGFSLAPTNEIFGALFEVSTAHSRCSQLKAIIDPSVDGAPQSKASATKGESLDDAPAPSGISLLASELGAEVIKVEEHE